MESHEKATLGRERNDKIKLEEEIRGWKSKTLSSKKIKEWDREIGENCRANWFALKIKILMLWVIYNIKEVKWNELFKCHAVF